MSQLAQTSVSSAFFEEVPECSSLPDEVRDRLSLKVESRQELKQLEKAARDAKRFLEPELYDLLIAELIEIKRDLVWLSSSRGKYVTAIDEWQQEFRAEFRAIADFASVYIGGHSKLQVVYVVGKVRDSEILAKLLEYVQSKNPPFKILHAIDIDEAA